MGLGGRCATQGVLLARDGLSMRCSDQVKVVVECTCTLCISPAGAGGAQRGLGCNRRLGVVLAGHAAMGEVFVQAVWGHCGS